MAITIDDFSKIWASTSPLTPYEFSENNYKSGWNFIGSTPPSRQMWDFLQKNNDEKMQYLANNYLPLSGGTMTGALTLADGGTALSNNVTDVSVSDYITALSGYSIRGAVLRVIGGVFIRARIGISFNTSVSANSTVSVATISKPYRPPANAGAFGGTMDGVMVIDADGSVKVKPASSKTSGSWMWADVFYSLI